MNKYKPNNIYNVDCYDAIKEIPDKSIDCVYIDIPYHLESLPSISFHCNDLSLI